MTIDKVSTFIMRITVMTVHLAKGTIHIRLRRVSIAEIVLVLGTRGKKGCAVENQHRSVLAFQPKCKRGICFCSKILILRIPLLSFYAHNYQVPVWGSLFVHHFTKLVVKPSAVKAPFETSQFASDAAYLNCFVM